jgi:LacI family transcriptional regulator
VDAESAVNAGQAARTSKRAATPPPSGPPAATTAPPKRPPATVRTPPSGTSPGAGTREEPTAMDASPNGPTGNGGPTENSGFTENGGAASTAGAAPPAARGAGAAPPAAREAGTAGTADGGIVVDITSNGDTGAKTANGPAGTLPGPAGGPAAGLADSTVPTIYDVARAAGVSIASVSRVLNGRRNPRPETRDRVLQAVSELGFIPDGAARALSVRLKEVAGVIIRLPWASRDPEDLFADEEDSLQFPDMINRGIAEAAQRRGFDILVRSVDLDEHDPGGRILTLARKSDGIILHDRVLEPDQLVWLARQVPVVTMAGVGTPMTANVRSDNTAGMRDLARHLLHDHGYRSISYIGGYVDSPDSIARFGSLAAEVADAGAEFLDGPEWQGNYTAGGGARVINNLLARHTRLPRAIVCANDQTAIGVLHTLERHGVSVPDDVAVTGFDDIPVARHLHTQLTTVRQRIRELGATAFEVLYSMINHQIPADRDIVLPTTLICRQSCGCGRERQA